MVTALPDDEVKDILYHAMPNLRRKKMTEQRCNYLDRSIQEMSGFFETWVAYLETPAPEPAIRSQCHVNCIHSTGECTTFKAPIKKSKSNKSKGYKKGGEKTCTKHKVNVSIEQEMRKLSWEENRVVI